MPLTKLQREFLTHCVIAEETKLSDTAWGEMVGVPIRTLQDWKSGARCKEFPALLVAAKKEYASNTDIFATKTQQWALEELVKAYKKAKQSDITEARKLLKDILERTKPADAGGPRVDYNDWTDDDLQAEVYKRDLSVTEEFKVSLRGEVA